MRYVLLKVFAERRFRIDMLKCCPVSPAKSREDTDIYYLPPTQNSSGFSVAEVSSQISSP
jgi:hypothetical protein